LIFLDECDALLQNDAMSSTLGLLLDQVSESSNDSHSNHHNSSSTEQQQQQQQQRSWNNIIVVAATNQMDAIPVWLRRPGRLDRELVVSPPNAHERLEILTHYYELLSSSSSSSPSSPTHHPSVSKEELETVAQACVGYVAADLAALVRRATLLQTPQKGTTTMHTISLDSLQQAMKHVGASVRRQ
jgi:SpoVK/Ycf46/Vps4 family AAA+-type ATPase